MVVDRTMYISGQLGMDTATGQLVAGGVQAQAKQVRRREKQRIFNISKTLLNIKQD